MKSFVLKVKELTMTTTRTGLISDSRRILPAARVAAPAPLNGYNIISLPRLDGLHHRYTVAA